jgi:hypothetical protein
MPRRLLFVITSGFLCVPAQEFDPRLSVHTIVREDVFAGFLENNFERLTQGEKKIDALLGQRADAKASLLAWKGGATLYRAVRAHEAKQPADFQRLYAEALDLFRQGREAGASLGYSAVYGGTYATLGDRLPEAERAAGWKGAYEAYREIYKAQEKTVDKMPLHLKGELLAGLAMSAQRTGKTEEATQWTAKIIDSMPGTPYAARALTWKNKPELMSRTSLACQSCHEQGRLAARQAALAKQP